MPMACKRTPRYRRPEKTGGGGGTMTRRVVRRVKMTHQLRMMGMACVVKTLTLALEKIQGILLWLAANDCFLRFRSSHTTQRMLRCGS